jgi:hypothetical protein
MASVRREVSFLPIARLIIGRRKLSLTIFPPMSGFGGLLIITEIHLVVAQQLLVLVLWIWASKKKLMMSWLSQSQR